MNAYRMRLLALAAAVGLTACQGELAPPVTAAVASDSATRLAWQPTAFTAGALAPLGDGWLAVSERDGLQLLDADGRERARLGERFEYLDTRSDADGSLLAASFDLHDGVAVLVRAGLDGSLRELARLPARDFGVESLCLYRDQQRHLYLFVLGDRGGAEQWLLLDGASGEPAVRPVRQLRGVSVAAACRVDDAAQRLYVGDDLGLWSYPAHPETEPERTPIALAEPFGAIAEINALAAAPGGLLALAADAGELLAFHFDGDAATLASRLPLPELDDPALITVRPLPNGLQLLVQDDVDPQPQWQQAELAWSATAASAEADMPYLLPSAQTDPVNRFGDVADDPAIWVHPQDPSHSRVLGTNKKGALLAYDLAGKQVQELPAGLINNVDVRYGLTLGEGTVDIAAASNRSDNSITVFAIDRGDGSLSELGRIATSLDEIYGFCMYQPAPGQMHVIANGKSGEFQQYALRAAGQGIAGELLRSFRVGSQPEGCVADDARRRLFIGEEDVAVWALPADPAEGSEMTQVIGIGGPIVDDIEGLAIYDRDGRAYLVVSSQGNDSYAVLDAEPPYRLRGSFRIGLDALAGIDGASETDGLEVSSANLGGPYAEGMLVVQDGRKVMPDAPQNFKYVPWSRVREALGLE